MSAKNEVRVEASKALLGASVAKFIAHHSAEAIKARGSFHVAFSGGSLPTLVAAGLGEIKAECDFSKWKVYFSDERCVPLDHKDSNYLAVKTEFMDKVKGIKPENVVTIAPDLVKDPAKAAAAYEKAMLTSLGSTAAAAYQKGTVPALDLILLGMGEDGHTCSLFPGHALLAESKKLISPITDSPKPPPQRITFTLPLVRAARARAFVAAGAGKVDILPKVLDDPASKLPSALVGKSTWFVDTDASAKLKKPEPGKM
eukprot:g73565.t1